MRLINAASSPSELAYALGYALGMVNALAHELAGGDSGRARALVANANGEGDDILDTQMKLMTMKVEEGDG